MSQTTEIRDRALQLALGIEQLGADVARSTGELAPRWRRDFGDWYERAKAQINRWLQADQLDDETTMAIDQLGDEYLRWDASYEARGGVIAREVREPSPLLERLRPWWPLGVVIAVVWIRRR